MKRFLIAIIVLIASISIIHAQSEFAAVLEVISSGVEVKRVDTLQWLPVEVEAIVGVGDAIRTTDNGEAIVTFFDDGTETTILANTELEIQTLTIENDSFQIDTMVLFGQTVQRLGKILDPASNYNVHTPVMVMAARGTEWEILVEEDGASAMLTTEGLVEATGENVMSEVPVGFGVLVEQDGNLGEVIEAEDFDFLLAANRGCSAVITAADDILYNVRSNPNRDAEHLGSVEPVDVELVFGQAEASPWYRIEFGTDFGWINTSDIEIGSDCPGLRIFPAEEFTTTS